MKGLILLSILFAAGLYFFKPEPTSSEIQLGEVIETKGTVMGSSLTDELFKNFQQGEKLFSSQKIITGFQSGALIRFGDLFQIGANSSVLLFKRANRPQIYLLSGTIERMNATENADLLVNNQISKDTKTSLTPATVQESSQSPLRGQATPPHNKLQTALDDTFKLHQRFIEKCFIKHYERKKGKTHSGLIFIQFQINKKGRLSEVKILQSEYEDGKFHDCLIEVVSRIRLKNSHKWQKRVHFPIQIQLP